ncbi:Gfo/Idh/MocA family oxidoreductase [Planotetraspora sp. A-T 1434]|uniref:Gfo/Idh/MocA family protein n=1 Tax=Planotetraspora sp. A-T 1434 TaxID=2979219 RepID=UPI0021BE568C|nr:Gfo/Idh/MocA family oxidoreductase [Planotetraspora sp. A-T 1434]MCT9934666.1 Gfo/Idh/MocA family oxidoreductase [Planotetraspora sp. A-T 1434]
MGQIGVGLVGHEFMGRAHSHAWRSVGAVFGPALLPAMAVLAGRTPDRAAAAAARLGWASATADWRDLLTRDDVQIIDICTPGDSHAEIAIAALEAGKHVLCEKPLANTLAEAEAMAAAARKAAANGVRNMVAFNYRRVPAIALARRLVEQGALGEIRHVRAQYLQDWIVDPQFPLVWRLRRELAGSGALGDIGSHAVDTAQYVTGQRLTGVSALTETFIKERPLATVSAGLAAQAQEVETGTVTVDDAALFIGRLSGGGLASFEASRFATGRKNALRLEVNGSLGSLAFDFEAMNELWVDKGGTGFRRVLVTEPDHPYAGAWWPPGHGLGYDHAFTNEIADFLDAVASGTDPAPSFEDGLRVQRVLAAVERSAANGSMYTLVEES